MKQIVNVFDATFNNDHQMTLVVSHPQKRSFRRDWLAAINAVRKEFPEDWCITDAWIILRDKGWKINRPKTLEVTY
jgi:hypothetical protein